MRILTLRQARLTAGLLGACLVGVLGAVLSSCVGTGGEVCVGECACPSPAAFTLETTDGGPPPTGASVSEYMARRCGTLDCHGSVTRPLRLYGRLGLRDPAGSDISGGRATTPDEVSDNYTAVCSVDPEQMQSLALGTIDPEDVLVLQKARGAVEHKGGTVVAVGSPGDNCIYGWLRGDPPETVATNCQLAINGL
jgi:hypothetical protein